VILGLSYFPLFWFRSSTTSCILKYTFIHFASDPPNVPPGGLRSFHSVILQSGGCHIWLALRQPSASGLSCLLLFLRFVLAQKERQSLVQRTGRYRAIALPCFHRWLFSQTLRFSSGHWRLAIT
jgi:hypothetical protein